jgi:hypothetical protein
MRVSATAVANFSGSASNPGASSATSCGMKSQAIASRTICEPSSRVAIWLAKCFASIAPSVSSTRE